MLGNCSCFYCLLLTFLKINCLKKSPRNTIVVLNNLDPDQDRHSVGPDLGSNCLKGYLQMTKFSNGMQRVILSTLQVNTSLFRVLCHIGHFQPIPVFYIPNIWIL